MEVSLSFSYLNLVVNAGNEEGYFADTEVSSSLDNVLRQRKTSTSVLSEQPVNRSRNASNLSRQSERTLSVPEHGVIYPSRQPSDPPQSIRAHADAGFVQFLKEHTSQ